MVLAEELQSTIQGEVLADEKTLDKYSHDASLFEVKPQIVVFPKNSDDIKNLVKFVSEKKPQNPVLALTARSGGTDMTGGPLSESIILDFIRYFNKIIYIKDQKAVVQPGMWYRDFEQETLKQNWLLPSYPASKTICAIGGMIANNSGGEKSLKYGKTEDYIEKLKVVLSDGREYEVRKLSKTELDDKMKQQDFEGEIYRRVFQLLDENYEIIKNARLQVSKNSAGYNIWRVWDKEKQEFDLTRLMAGSQGTLSIVTEATLRLIKTKSHSGLLVMFLKKLDPLPQIVKAILPNRPVSFEAFDDNTFKLAAKFFFSFRKTLGTTNLFALAWQFLPEVWKALTGGIPKLVLLAEFEGDNQEEIDSQIKLALENIRALPVKTLIANTKAKAKKYWVMRRESFNLLRQRVKGKRTAPFIDDLIVKPEHLPEFMPKLYKILDKYELLYTVAGHVGDGNLHIIPLMEMKTEAERDKIFSAMEEVYKLVLDYGGSFTAEHNDGLIRTPYLKMMYGDKIYGIFEEIKKIFDPQNIFNPGKKVGGDLEYAKKHIKIS